MLRDALFAGLAIALANGAAADDAAVVANPLADAACGGALSQGGLVVCEGPPGVRFTLGSRTLTTGPDGQAVFGLRRDAPDTIDVTIRAPGLEPRTQTLNIAPRNDVYRVIEGMDCDKVDARTEAQKAHASRSWVKKTDAFALFTPGPGAATGFARPAEGRTSSPFGPTRKYVGVSAETGEPCDKTSVHRGYDIAAPIGTEIIAPAPGTVALAEDDLYYEGGTVFLDHGHGLVSVFLHMSAVDVAVGDQVDTGDRLGAVGNTGRTTGPHLHWAVKWRDPTSTDRGGDFYVDPALLLELGAND